jgi:zinc protease
MSTPNQLNHPQQTSIPGPDDITRTTLANGITVLARRNFNSPSVVISGYLQVGGLFEPNEKDGLASFCASALMRGTGQHSFQTLYDALESVGASLGFNGGTHTTGFGGKALAEDLRLLLGLLSESLRQPTFPAQQVERLRAQILTSLAIQAQDTHEMAQLSFDQLVYAGHPYSRPEEGTPQSVAGISRDDLANFHQGHYGPSGMVVTVVGAVEPERAINLVNEILGDWQNPQQTDPPELPAVTPLAETATKRVTIPGKVQADIVLGAPGPARRSPDFLAAALGNNILGQFGMMGRIGEVVREQAGLAYYAYSSVSGGIGPGAWYVSAGVNPANIDTALELIQKEITRYVSEPVSTEELNDSKTNFIGRLPLSLETNHGVASALVNLEKYGLGLDYYEHYAELVQALSAEELLDTAKRYLDPQRLGIAVAGP